MEREKIFALVRLALAIIAFVNSVTLAGGYNPLETILQMVPGTIIHVIDCLIIIYGCWKNNNITNKANRDSKLLKAIACGKAYVMDVQPIEGLEEVTELEIEYAEVE